MTKFEKKCRKLLMRAAWYINSFGHYVYTLGQGQETFISPSYCDHCLTWNFEHTSNSVTGYMCATDWECEIGLAAGGCTVYSSLQDAIDTLKCAENCGIVEVQVSFKAVALKGVDLD